MRPRGRTFLVAGSADAQTPETDLLYAHALVRELTRALAGEGARFVVPFGKEPRLEGREDGPSIIFDWTVAEAIHTAIGDGLAQPSGPSGKIITTIAAEKTFGNIPQHRRNLYDGLRSAGAISMEFLEPGWGSGAIRRQRQAQLADIFIALSGGEGVEHLAQEFSSLGKQVLPLDLELGASCRDGSGGAPKLFREALKWPGPFFSVRAGESGPELLDSCSARACAIPTLQVTGALLRLIDALVPPKAFYVRLLNKDLPEYAPVERFFRDVVDPTVTELGFEILQMGLGVNEFAWMNQAIFDSLHYSNVAVVDLTGLRNNCFMELGYALGRPQRAILTARKGTALPFDSFALEAFLWDPARLLEEVRKEFREHWARNINMPPLVRPRGLR
jgi:hypothetical protein